MHRRPNILIILLDDLGIGQFAPVAKELELDQLDPGFLAYTDALGDDTYDKQTALEAARDAMPFMSRLSEKAAVFSRAFATSSLCAPSRQGLLTGCNQTRWGAYRNIDINVCGLPRRSCLVDHFRSLEYRTGLVGKWHVGSRDHAMQEKILAAGGTEQDVVDSGYWGSVCEKDHPLNNGFDYSFFYNRWECDFYDSRLIWENREFTGRQTQYNTDLFTDKAIGFMEQALDDGKPFVMDLALHAVHIPLNVDAPETYARRFNTGYTSIDQFYSHVYGVDESIRRIVEMLQARGAWQNTMLFFASDNGATCKYGGGDLSLIPGNGRFRGHKGQYFQGGIRVPLMMVWPEQIKEQIHVDQAVSLMDILPTALEAAGVDIPEGLDGKSLLPLLEHPDAPVRERLYFTGIHAPSWGYSGAYASVHPQKERDRFPGAWVIVEGDWLLRYVGTLDPGLMQDYPDGQEPFFGLFNIKADPLELHDLYEQEPDVAARLKAAYDAHARTLPVPHAWDRTRWIELVPQDNVNVKQGVNQ
jgi:uncharacterized sulfatase